MRLVIRALFLVATCSAAPRVRHLGDFRGWDGLGCSSGNSTNLGIWTVLEDEVVGGPCTGFNGQIVWSLSLEDIEPDCNMYAFSGPDCSDGRRVHEKTCLSQQGGFTGWKMICGEQCAPYGR